MKNLKEVIPDAAALLKMDLEKLGHAVLHCVHSSPDPVKRKGLAKKMAEPYHSDVQHEVSHAIEEALGWLASQCLLGASPYEEDLMFVTRRGQDELKNGEHPWGPADVV